MSPHDSHALRSELATLRNEVAAIRATRPARRGWRRATRRAGAALSALLLMALVPLSLLAANPFNDLTPGSVHNGNIDAIYNAGITTGCVPNESYCPADLVTRQEMASFLARTAGLGNNPPVANAKTAQTATTATNATNAVNAQNAQNADTLNGLASNAIVRATRASATTPATISVNEASYLTVSINAPGKGQVLVTATVDLATNNTSCPCTVEGRLINDHGVGGNTYSNSMEVSLPNQDNYHATMTLTYLFTVEPGSNSFRVLLDRSGGDVLSVERAAAQATALFLTDGSFTPTLQTATTAAQP